MRVRSLLSVTVTCVLSFFLTACGGGNSQTASTPAPSSPAPGSTSAGSPPPSSSQPGSGGSGTSGGTSGSGGGTSSGGTVVAGGFTEKITSIPFSGTLITANFNRDGHQDLLMYGRNGGLLVMLNDGSGNFSVMPIALPNSFTMANAAALGDLNGDSYPDAAACVTQDAGSTQTSALAVYLNDDSGNLVLSQTISAPNGCNGIAAGDANRDSKSDIAITFVQGTLAQPTSGITSFLNDGNGHFSNPITQNVTLTAHQDSTRNPCSILGAAGADFDGDGTLDLFLFGSCQASAVNTGDKYFAKGDGTGHYVLSEISEENTSLFGSPVVKDVNGDGKPDVVFMQEQQGPHASFGSDLDFAINAGGGKFTFVPAAQESAYAGSGGHFTTGTSVDYNGDGATDAVEGFWTEDCCGPFTYGVKLYAGQGGKFTLSQTYVYGQSTNDTSPGDIRGSAAADFNGNGTQDFAVAAVDANSKATLHIYIH